MPERTEYELLLKDEKSLLQEIAELEAILHDAQSDLRHVRSQLIVQAPMA